MPIPTAAGCYPTFARRISHVSDATPSNKQTFWCIRADGVRKLDRGEPEPETASSGTAASPEALDASDPAPF